MNPSTSSVPVQIPLQTVINGVPTPIFYKDTNLLYLGCNKAFEDFFGTRQKDILGKTIFEFYTSLPSKAQKVHTQDEDFLSSDLEQLTYEVPLMDAQGKKHPMVVTKTKFYQEDGTLGGFVGIMFDFSKYEQTEEELKQKQIYLRTLMDAIPHPILYKDTQFKYIDCNKYFADFAKNSREELIGKNTFDVFPEERAWLIQERDTRFIESPDPVAVYDGTWPYKGEIRDFIVTRAKLFYPGNTLAGFVTTIFDISDQKKLEAELKQEKFFLRTLMDAVPTPIAYKDTHLKYLDCNKAFEAFTEHRHEDIVGKTVFECFSPERAKRIHEEDKKFLHSNHQETSYEIELPDQGETKDFHIIKTKFYLADGTLGGFVSTISDITDSKRLRENLRAINQQLALRNEQMLESVRLQTGMQGNHEEFTKHFKEAFVFARSRDSFSGDFYWFSRREDKLFLAAADCTGHGLTGALTTMLCHALLHQIVNEQNITQPDEVLALLDVKLQAVMKKSRIPKEVPVGMDIAFCSFAPQKKRLQFAGAHHALYCLRHGRVKEIKGSPFTIGGQHRRKEKSFRLHTITLREDDVFYLSSDGFLDQMNPQKKKFLNKNFIHLLEESHALTLAEQKKKLAHVFESWKGAQHQTDDVLILGVKISCKTHA
ncbi:MAG: PAS domain-containing protein [Verrucomicrobiota bacterium]